MDRLTTPPPDDEVESDCGICNGTGYVTIPAHQSGDKIIDEVERECVCQIRDDDFLLAE